VRGRSETVPCFALYTMGSPQLGEKDKIERAGGKATAERKKYLKAFLGRLERKTGTLKTRGAAGRV